MRHADPPPTLERRAHPRLRTVGVVAVAVLFLAPIWVLVSGSLRPLGEPPPRTLSPVPADPAFSNYGRVFDTVDLGRELANSVLVAAVAVPLAVVVATWAGFAIARLGRRAALALVGLAVIAFMVPPTALFVGRLAIFRVAGVTDTPIPLVAPALIGVTPISVLLFAWAYRRIPTSHYDLAAEAGLSPVATWWRVAVPQTRGVTGAAAALAFIVTWGNVLDPLIYVTDDRWFTAPLGIRALATLPAPDRPLMLAGAVITVVPVLIVFWMLQRRAFAAWEGDAE